MKNYNSIYSESCWINGELRPAKISFANGLITSIEHGKSEGAWNAGKLIIMPGIIDAHVHVNEPGRTNWEGFETATAAAAAGGITTIVDMPLNASPVTTTVDALNKKLQATFRKLHVNCGFYGGLVPGNLNELDALIHAGVLGIKCFLTHSGIDEFPEVNEQQINTAMNIMAKYKIPLLAHCELTDDEVEENDLPVSSYKKYLLSRPDRWEMNAIDLMIRLCRKNKCKTHIVHVSSSLSLIKIKDAKDEGLPLTAETCPHYILFNAEGIPDGKTIYKCAPPVRDRNNNEALKAALVSGVLDLISTDHSPAPPSVKEIETGDLQKGWGGIAGLQFLLPAAWTAMQEKCTLEKFIPLLTSKPAELLGLSHRKGKLEIGFDADLVCWNPEERYIVAGETILHRHKISPYTGMKLSGKVIKTIVGGQVAFDESGVSETRHGKIILKEHI